MCLIEDAESLRLQSVGFSHDFGTPRKKQRQWQFMC
jgi:hypothetical protein